MPHKMCQLKKNRHPTEKRENIRSPKTPMPPTFLLEKKDKNAKKAKSICLICLFSQQQTSKNTPNSWEVKWVTLKGIKLEII
ncbi:MAG: hypothetical protein MI742_12015 [Desulfobacterales bacterium]|nr:hypothetical protein [Desulfobacterales bacterium]